MSEYPEKTSAVHDTRGRPIRDLRVSVTDRCNLRCTYCMPEDEYDQRYVFLHKAQLLTYEEIARLARVFTRFGVAKIRITGGEPLLRKDLHRLVALLAGLDGIDDVALTTNGLALAQQAQALKDAGLNRVTVSLDTLDDALFQAMTGRPYTTAPVLEGIDAAVRAGLAPVKINVVVQRGVNDHTLLDLVDWGRAHGHILRFIEYMDVGNRNRWRCDQVVPSREILERIAARHPLEPLESQYRGEVAERYAYRDGRGEIGFISSVTEPFCGACTRARISSDGKLLTCLFATDGADLRGPLRNGADDEAIYALIRAVWERRTDRYSELRGFPPVAASGNKIEMHQIGG